MRGSEVKRKRLVEFSFYEPLKSNASGDYQSFASRSLANVAGSLNDASIALQVSTWINDRCWRHWCGGAVDNWCSDRCAGTAAAAGSAAAASRIANNRITAAAALLLEQLAQQTTALLGSTTTVAAHVASARITGSDLASARRSGSTGIARSDFTSAARSSATSARISAASITAGRALLAAKLGQQLLQWTSAWLAAASVASARIASSDFASAARSCTTSTR